MRRNNMCLEYNRHFEDMKAGMADIDDSNPAKLYAFIEEHLTPKTVEKKTNGEVFTPLPLVREMLGAIETYADKTFWTNPDLKILDPAAGIGNFPLIAFEKLMEGLKKRIPSAAKRKRHILEKMLYMVELNGNNTRMVRRIFNGKEYKLNIVKGDFLSPKTHKKLAELMGVEEPKFDLVMGNPPFNDSKGIRGGGRNLYTPFVTVSLQLLDRGGLLSMISPLGILKTTDFKAKTPVLDLMMSMQILRLNINECKKHFPGVSSNFMYMIIKNNKSEHVVRSSTAAISAHTIDGNNINLSGFNWIPVVLTRTSVSIIRKCSLNTFEFQREDQVKDYSNKVTMCRQNHINYDNCSMKASSDFANAKKSKCGALSMSVKSFAEALSLCNILNSKLFKFINIVSRYDSVIYHNLLNQFGTPNGLLPKISTENDVYALYNINDTERELIEKLVSNPTEIQSRYASR
jgi:N-6 DNA Methylase